MDADALYNELQKLHRHLIDNPPTPKDTVIVDHGTHVEIQGDLYVRMSHDTFNTLIKHSKLN